MGYSTSPVSFHLQGAAARNDFPSCACGHDLCFKIRATNPATPKACTALAVVLVAPVNGAQALLLTKNCSAEAEYGMTAGVRNLLPDDCGCYLNASARILREDANIPEALVHSHVTFSSFRRLRKTGVPVLVGKMCELNIRDFDGMSCAHASCTTRLFRYDYSQHWRVVGTRYIRPVSDGVRHVCAEINLNVCGRS
jgi:hypothetical protein